MDIVMTEFFLLYFSQPAAVLLIAGTGLYVHYNDEKRAILKGMDLLVIKSLRST